MLCISFQQILYLLDTKISPNTKKIMNEKKFILDCIEQYRKSIIDNDVSDKLIELKKSLLEVKKNNKKVIIAGNGVSAAVASHFSRFY